MRVSLGRRLGRTAASAGLSVGSLLGRLLPLRALWGVADALAGLVILLARRRGRMADANIAAAFPEMSPTERRGVYVRSVRNAARTVGEMLKLPYLRPEDLRRLVPVPPLDPVREALAAGSGVLMITAHLGQWEWSAIRLADGLGQPMSVVARPHKHPGADQTIRDARLSHGLRVLDRDETLEMVRVLKTGGLLGILPDQHALEGGVQVDFMGRPAWSVTGPAWLARATRARVFAGFCIRHWDGTFEGVLLPELEMVATQDRDADLIENTRRVNAAIEQAIRMAPDNWLWLHDRWKTEEQRTRHRERAAAAL